MKLERRQTELRSQGRTLAGTAIRYGDIAELPWGREKFIPGAFADLANSDVIMNVQHDRGRAIARTQGGGLVLEDSSEALRIRAELADSTDANDALLLVRQKILRGLSIEFQALEERNEADLRIIEKARLSGVSVVDSGQYPGSTVEARAKGAGLKGKIPTGKNLDCKCHRGTCKKSQY